MFRAVRIMALPFICIVAKFVMSIHASAAIPMPTPTPTPLCCCLPATTTQYESSKVIYQQFPSRGPAETAWVIVWSEAGHKGLWIEGAWFWRKRPFTGATIIQVLGRAGLSNLFVPYHTSNPTFPFRFYDLNQWAELAGAIPQDAGDCGTLPDPLVPSPLGNPARRVLIKEIRDRGVAWTSDRQTRRGEELLLWSSFDAGNYEYIIQYGFRDDGTITFRAGSTGYNSPERPDEAHMHNALWYLDINLGGWANNSVMVMKHTEPYPSWSATDTMALFNNGFEGGIDWNAEDFTHLNISNTQVTNSQGKNISYDLMPMRAGTARHVEDFSRHDFWVTQMKSNEVDYWPGFEGWYAQNYITPPEPINGQNSDIVVWYISSNHHLPRDEDHENAQPIRLPGVALVMWSGFDLHPRNFFNDTPLHEPPCAPVPQNLVAWWPMDDAPNSPTIVNIDAAGAANPTLNGLPKSTATNFALPASVSGAVNGAINFSGNNYIEVPDNPAINVGNTDFSIDAWIKTSQATAVATILDKRRTIPYQGYHLFTSNGVLFMQLASGGSFNNYSSTAFVADGNWHHIAVSVDRANQLIRWYLDGILKPSTPIVTAGSLNNTWPLRLGIRSFQLGASWAGTLDELEIYKRALTDSEVFRIYAAGRNGKCR